MASNAVATLNGRGLAASAPGDSTWDVMLAQARVLVTSGFLPQSIKTPEQAVAIILTGDELGIPKMLALRSIVVINGKPTLSADLMVALVQRAIDDHRDGEFRVLPPTPEKCTVNYRRWGWSEGHSYTYTIQDAQRAGLAGKGTWAAHPAAMLRARATSAVCRMAFPDVISGIYTPDEAAEFEANQDGAVRWGNVTVLPSTDDEQGSVAVEPEPTTRDVYVDTETGELFMSHADRVALMDAKDIKPEIEQLTKTYWGWDAADIKREARASNINLNTDAGRRQFLVQVLEAIDAEEADSDEPDPRNDRTDDDHNAIDATFQTKGLDGMPGVDRYTR